MRLSREKTVRLSHRIIDLLVSVPEVDFVEDRDTIRLEVVNILTSLLKIEEQVDTEARAKIGSQKKEILEGSEEWDILYRKYYSEGLKRLGVAEVHAHQCQTTTASRALGATLDLGLNSFAISPLNTVSYRCTYRELRIVP